MFDAIIAGVVPVYLGATDECRKLLPHPNAAIFVSDFKDVASLARYLQHLMHNATAYNMHRVWHSNAFKSTTTTTTNLTPDDPPPTSPPRIKNVQFIADSKGRPLDPKKHYPLASTTMSPLLSVSWPCRICQWAVRTMEQKELSSNAKALRRPVCTNTDFPRKKKPHL